ncbi:MAG: HNH endonuclease signature motif containing protein, partial [Acidimicrobiales bacterium]
VLDLGRATRVPNAAQRRAIRARDQGCAVPGCPTPPDWCDVHHIRFWTKHHGPTDLTNLVMVCNTHHTMVPTISSASKATEAH